MTASLARTLKDVRARIARASSHSLGENTKATLIEPVLRALGWGAEDVDEGVWKLHGAGGELVEVDTVRQAFGEQGNGEARNAP